MSTLYSTELKDLKGNLKLILEKYQKSLQKIVKLEEDNKDAKFKKYEIETELKVFKNHYKESENTLQEYFNIYLRKFNQERMKVVDLERRLESVSFDSAKVPDLRLELKKIVK